jgi:electron transfer flavoprotein alpha subunit
MTEEKTIMVCGEQKNGKISKITKEVLAAGKKLANEQNWILGVIIMGTGAQKIGNEAISYGADRVYLLENTQLDEYNPDIHTDAITQVCKKLAPDIVLFGQTVLGRDIAGRVAFRLGCVPVTDCINLAVETVDKSLLYTRSVYGGNAEAVVSSKESLPQIASLRPGIVTPLDPDFNRKGDIESLEVTIDPSVVKIKLIEDKVEELEGVNLEDAEVVVAGGGGIGDAEGFNLLQDLAKIWGGAVGTTTVPFDEGWIPTTKLVIGDSGKTVKPDLYFAIGIRGASQHITGCSESKVFVSINKDADAGIFKVSDIGVVADYRQILPLLIKKCQVLKEE